MSQPNLPDRVVVALERFQRGDLPDPDARRNPKAARYHRRSRSESTNRVYLYFIKQWLKFCEQMGRREAPAHAASLEDFVIWLAEMQPLTGRNRNLGGGMSPNTLKTALAAVRAFHVAMGEAWPSTDLAYGAIEGHANMRHEDLRIEHDGEGVPPIKMPTLLELIRACPTDTNAGIRDRAMLSAGFAVMARRAELANTDLEGVKVERDGTIRFHIRKTKVGRKGRTAIIVPWADYPAECPVAALSRYVEHLGAMDIKEGPLFRSVDKWDHVHGAGSWAGNSRAGVRMDPTTVERVIARAAARAIINGVDIENAERLRPHGLRAGGATSAYEAGADILSIARQGGWGDKSPVVFKYIREVDMKIRNPMWEVGRKAKPKERAK